MALASTSLTVSAFPGSISQVVVNGNDPWECCSCAKENVFLVHLLVHLLPCNHVTVRGDIVIGCEVKESWARLQAGIGGCRGPVVSCCSKHTVLCLVCYEMRTETCALQYCVQWSVSCGEDLSHVG